MGFRESRKTICRCDMPKTKKSRRPASLTAPPPTEPVLRVAPMPSDCNANGDIFGGWVLSQMDIASGTVASRRAQGRVVTVAVESMTFHKPIKVGDIVSIYADVVRVGRTSVAIGIDTFVARRLNPEPIKVTEGVYTFVAIDARGRPRPIPK
jgi:acyl-CoA thioesterase YciA